MIKITQVISEARKHHPEVDVKMIERAYELCVNAHQGQKRKSGEPYHLHPVEVALILAQLKMDTETITTGLLHDVVEDTEMKLEEIQEQYGVEVAHLVDGVTKLSQVSFRSKDVRQAESFRKMLLAMAQDIRVIIIKLADRLHNMRTLEFMSEMQQRAIAQETLDIYAPLANRLGMAHVKNELENLSFKYLRPNAYEKIVQNLKNTAKERDRYIAQVIRLIEDHLKKNNIHCDVSGRAKSPYSIFKKMESQNLEFGEVADILAFRVIVDTNQQCYEVLGHMHTLGKPVPGKFKDYIAIPKANGYQSLHSTIIGPKGQRIEIQIRTHEMHQFAEEGIAAHWLYKDGNSKSKKKDLEKFAWLRQMVEYQTEIKDSHEFIQSVKTDLFGDEVYVFTPGGEVLDFPRGSTPVDFAYRIHTEVGHHCSGAKVNGKLVPLKYRMQNGDTIEIITSEHSRPTRDWLRFAVTSKAKSKIRMVIKEEQRDTGRAVGKEMLSRELKRHGLRLESLLSDGTLRSRVESAGYKDVDDFFLSIGYGKTTIQDVLPLFVNPDSPESTDEEKKKFLSRIVSKVRTIQSDPVMVGGHDDVMIRYGKCCDPLPGDPIVGYVTRGRGVTIHRADCFKVLEMDDARKIEVQWHKKGTALRNVKITVVTTDTPGILASISKAISQVGGNISHASIKTTNDRKAVNTFEVGISDAAQLYSLMKSIERLQGIISVDRIKG